MLCPQCGQPMEIQDVTVTLPELPTPVQNPNLPVQEQVSEMNENMKKLYPDWAPPKMTEGQLLEISRRNATRERAFEMYVCPRCGAAESAHEPDPSWI